MTDTSLPLGAEFPAADEDTWLKLVQKTLKDSPFERLISKTYDGLAIQPLYRETHFPTAADPAGAPGFFPFTRGALPVRDGYLPWDIRQGSRHPDPKAANAEILEDLQGGVSSVWLTIDPYGANGIQARNEDDLHTILDGVNIEAAPVALNAGAYGLDVANLLIEIENAANAPKAELRTAYGLDPIGVALSLGALPFSVADAAAFAVQLNRPKSTALAASARAVHDAGGSEAQELGVLAAIGAAYVDALTDSGHSPAQANAAILFQLAVGPEYGLEIAKLRAARRIWSRVMQAWGAAPADSAMKMHAVTSFRMLTQRDPWVNVLRNTAACFAAGAAGVDAVTVLPFTDALGNPNALARRLSRNTHIILQEESNIGRVADPAGGAWSVEAETEDFAKAGWAFFQEIEKQGGIQAVMESGWLQAEVAKVRKARTANIARRKDALIGVSEFPQIGETMPSLETVSAPVRAATPTDFAARIIKPVFEALPQWRLAEGFEKLRDKADAATAKGKKPAVFIAALGPVADHSARAQFTQNLLAAGGVSNVEAADAADHGATFKSSGLAAACICGSDAAYAAQAASTAKALKAAGASWVILAGKPGDNEAALKEAGIDQFIFAGLDAIAALETVQAALGVE
jgi:methylmalonyl-CoA mutase